MAWLEFLVVIVSRSGMFSTGLLGGVTNDGDPGESGRLCGNVDGGELGTGDSPWSGATC